MSTLKVLLYALCFCRTHLAQLEVKVLICFKVAEGKWWCSTFVLWKLWLFLWLTFLFLFIYHSDLTNSRLLYDVHWRGIPLSGFNWSKRAGISQGLVLGCLFDVFLVTGTEVFRHYYLIIWSLVALLVATRWYWFLRLNLRNGKSINHSLLLHILSEPASDFMVLWSTCLALLLENTQLIKLNTGLNWLVYNYLGAIELVLLILNFKALWSAKHTLSR